MLLHARHALRCTEVISRAALLLQNQAAEDGGRLTCRHEHKLLMRPHVAAAVPTARPLVTADLLFQVLLVAE